MLALRYSLPLTRRGVTLCCRKQYLHPRDDVEALSTRCGPERSSVSRESVLYREGAFQRFDDRDLVFIVMHWGSTTKMRRKNVLRGHLRGLRGFASQS